MRPADPRRAVFILIDGARADILRELLDRGDLPNLARWVLEPGGLRVGTTVFPSTTGVAYIPFIFGRYPGHVGIPGIRWLDRARAGGGWRDQWRAARSYCGVQGGWLNQDITPASSLFELVPESIAICTPITRGLRPGAHRIPLKRAFYGSAAHFFGTYRTLDRAVSQAWLAAADDPWRLLFVVFPGVDGVTHLRDPHHALVLARYRAVDDALGAFMARVRRSGEVPALFVAADHGATTMHEHCDIAVELERWGFRTARHPLHVWRRNAAAATMVSGNASIQLYLEPRSGRWTPRTESEIPADTLERILRFRAVRLAAYRADSNAGEDRPAVIVRTNRARAVLSERLGGRLIRYEPLEGDPLGLGGYLELEDRELLLRSRETDVPDAPRQLLQLFATPRAGDVVLAAVPGADFRGPWEIPEHRAGHGSLIREHMEVPIAASVRLPTGPIRTVDVMPAMLDYLGVPLPAVGLDGIAFSQLDAQQASMLG
jgi:hypothetical protein